MRTLNKCPRKQAGVTMVEIMVGLAVTGVLTSAALPSFDRMLRTRRLVPTTHELVTSLNLARSEAMARGARVAIAARGANWAAGWQVFADANDNGVLDVGEQVIREFSTSAPGMTITPQFGITYPGTVLSYEATGRLAHPGNHGMVLGRPTLAQGGDVRTLCFASLRVAEAPNCS